ncbi:hypothetical protein DRO31_03045 [Candidatus Bathyarchaeota archaeon]|nr:MAG: hypothetical protein DRO31_03045 [Candidatus Bathyarchaeota archaeon]
MRNVKNLIYKPFSLLYLAFLAFILLTIAGYFISFLKGILVDAVGIPQEYFWAVTFLSLIGSSVNFPLFVLESVKPVTLVETVDIFGVKRMLPHITEETNETVVMINLGGAVIPTLISAYLLLVSIPSCSPNLWLTYLQTLVVLVVVISTTHQSAQIVEGLGITTPAWGPPTMTAFVVFLINYFTPVSCATQIAYIGGTLGALIGADLMNLGKIAGVGPVVSIGGAGTFDGVYLTGLMSVLIVLLLG